MCENTDLLCDNLYVGSEWACNLIHRRQTIIVHCPKHKWCKLSLLESVVLINVNVSCEIYRILEYGKR